MELNFEEWLVIEEYLFLEAVGTDVVDPYFMDDPSIGLDVKNKAKSEFYILFTVLSAGKPTHQQVRGLMYFLSLEQEGSPFEKVRKMLEKGTLIRNLALAGIGTFNRYAKTFIALAKLDIDKFKDMPEEELEKMLRKIPNISDKIISFIKLYSHNQRTPAILDRHILRAMKKILKKMHQDGETLPDEITGGMDLATLASKIPADSPKQKEYAFWAKLWLAIMKAKGLNDLDVWRHQAMIGVDPMWRYRAAKRGRVSPKAPVYTDEEGKEVINLSIDRKGHKRGDRDYPPVKKKVFLRTDVDDAGEHIPYTGATRVLGGQPSSAAMRSPEGEELIKTKGGYAYASRLDTPYTGEQSPEAQSYRQRWIDQFRRYHQQGLYAGLTGKDKRKYELYLKKLGLA